MFFGGKKKENIDLDPRFFGSEGEKSTVRQVRENQRLSDSSSLFGSDENL